MSGLPADIAAAPVWVEWIAQDADGAWWGYEAEPNRHDTGWYENEVGRYARLGHTAPPPDWTETLMRRQRSSSS